MDSVQQQVRRVNWNGQDDFVLLDDILFYDVPGIAQRFADLDLHEGVEDESDSLENQPGWAERYGEF